jgi:hypothetical protein
MSKITTQKTITHSRGGKKVTLRFKLEDCGVKFLKGRNPFEEGKQLNSVG